MKKFGLIPLAMMLAASPVLAKDTTVKWGTSGNWRIVVDKTTGNGCSMITSYQTGVWLRVGLNLKQKTVDLVFSNPAWKSLEYGKDYPLKLYFDRDMWTGNGTVGRFAGTKTKYIRMVVPTADLNKATRFLQRVRKAHGVRLVYSGRTIVNLAMSGSYAAVGEMLKCQDALNKFARKKQPGGDPFRAVPAAKTDDPFAGGI